MNINIFDENGILSETIIRCSFWIKLRRGIQEYNLFSDLIWIWKYSKVFRLKKLDEKK